MAAGHVSENALLYIIGEGIFSHVTILIRNSRMNQWIFPIRESTVERDVYLLLLTLWWNKLNKIFVSRNSRY